MEISTKRLHAVLHQTRARHLLLAHKDDRYLAHKKSSFRIIGDAYLGRVPNDLHRALYTF